MGFKITNRSDAPTAPVEVTFIEDFPGGGTLAATGLSAGDVIQKGTLVAFNESTRIATVVKSAVLAEAADATAVDYKVAKKVNGQPHNLKVGEFIAAVKGGKSYAITAIDTSDAGFDKLTIGTTLGVALEVGTVLMDSKSSGAAAGALKTIPNGWLRDDAEIGENEFVAIGRVGTLYERRLPGGVSQAVKDELKGNVNFSQQH